MRPTKKCEFCGKTFVPRSGMQKLFGFLKGRPLTERENILRSEIFMKRWRTSAEVILNRMIEIEKYLTQ